MLVSIYLVASKVSDAASEGCITTLGDCHVGDCAQELRRQTSGGFRVKIVKDHQTKQQCGLTLTRVEHPEHQQGQ